MASSASHSLKVLVWSLPLALRFLSPSLFFLFWLNPDGHFVSVSHSAAQSVGLSSPSALLLSTSFWNIGVAMAELGTPFPKWSKSWFSLVLREVLHGLILRPQDLDGIQSRGTGTDTARGKPQSLDAASTGWLECVLCTSICCTSVHQYLISRVHHPHTHILWCFGVTPDLGPTKSTCTIPSAPSVPCTICNSACWTEVLPRATPPIPIFLPHNPHPRLLPHPKPTPDLHSHTTPFRWSHTPS